METADQLRHLFAYDDWANREVIASFKKTGAPPPRSLSLMAHILGAEYVWFARLNQENSPLAVWPELTLAECEDHAVRLQRLWTNFLSRLAPPQSANSVAYKNSKGESWTNSIADILMHVVMHSAYHRGQIAADMRASGHTPASTDFIHGVRQKLVE
jgi:uncharacterized damage-inducible protein DinB